MALSFEETLFQVTQSCLVRCGQRALAGRQFPEAPAARTRALIEMWTEADAARQQILDAEQYLFECPIDVLAELYELEDEAAARATRLREADVLAISRNAFRLLRRAA